MTSTATVPERCERCRRPMRGKGTPRTPGVMRHYAQGICSSCNEKARRPGRHKKRTGPTPQLNRGPARPVDTSWHALGACRDVDAETAANFYHPDGERSTTKERRAAKAKAICIACPVREICRDDARARREPFGTWGGESENEREQWLAEQDALRRAERRAS